MIIVIKKFCVHNVSLYVYYYKSSNQGITLYKDIVCLMKKSLDSEAHQNKDWVLEEALNLERLEETGSFRKALIEKLKRIVLPALANVLSFIDQYNNLDTLEDGNDHQKEAWIILFRNNMQYFTNNVDHANSITCEFPFSWVVYNEFCKAMTDNGKCMQFQSKLFIIFLIITRY